MATNLLPPPTPSKPITIAIAGCGNRGNGYAKFAEHFPEWLKVVAVADHHEFKCQKLAKEHGIPAANIFNDWSEMAKASKLADAVAICTTDREHIGPAVAFANQKYNILLEKPMSINVQECVQIHEAVTSNNVILAVCHVLRYTEYTKAVKRILDSKVLGDIINIQHLEPVGFWHFAHSFVRGNWHNENASTFSLLSKSCHDVDLVSYMIDSKCKRVSSFGNLSHFAKKNKPKEAGNAVNCLDCPYEASCPYSAKKIYIENHVKKGWKDWPINVVQPKEPVDVENLTAALWSNDYGRCVYEMDNDVCDHQVVNMEYENGSTVSFSMVAFTESICARKTRIFGTRGELEGDGEDTIKVFDFLTQTTKVIRPSLEPDNIGLPLSGHGGGDFSLMQAFVYACVTGNQKYILSGPQETLDTHIYCFAAEHARKTGTVVDIDEFKKSLYKS